MVSGEGPYGVATNWKRKKTIDSPVNGIVDRTRVPGLKERNYGLIAKWERMGTVQELVTTIEV